MFALIYNGKVVQLSEDTFEVADPMSWVECDSSAKVGNVYSPAGGISSLFESSTLEEVKVHKLGELSSFRYDKEVGGVVYLGKVFGTSRDAQNQSANAAVVAMNKKSQNLWFEFDWKTSDGWCKLNCDQMIALADRILNHVQHCFSQERKFATIIQGLSDKDEVASFDFGRIWKE